MDPLILIRVLDVAGIFVFALSGGLVAVRNDLDVLGVVTIAFLPAMGGGTIRDLLLGVPVFWLTDPLTLAVAFIGGMAAFFASDFWPRLRVLVWIDAVGLALFAMVGAYKSATLGHNLAINMIMGAITAAAGGVLRDMVCGEKVMMLREDIYVSAALLGGLVFSLLGYFGLGSTLSLLAGALATFAVRSAGIVFDLDLPRARKREPRG